MHTFKEYIAEKTKSLGKLIDIKQMNADGEEIIYLTFQDYTEDSPIDFDLELVDLNIKKMGKLVYGFTNGYGDLDYTLDVTKEQEKTIKGIK